VRAYRLLVERGASGTVYNVCTGVDVPISRVAEDLRSRIYPEARFAEDAGLARPLDIPVLRGDPTRLRDATGWSPSITLDATLADVVAEAAQLA